jgi:hypothetical protein
MRTERACHNILFNIVRRKWRMRMKPAQRGLQVTLICGFKGTSPLFNMNPQ